MVRPPSGGQEDQAKQERAPVRAARNPDARTRRLERLAAVVDDPDDMVWLTFSEEVLRYYAPVTMGRRVVGDASVSGCPVHAGDQVLVTFPAANHDLDVFDRFEPRPARDEIAFQEWASAFPDDRLDPE